MDRVDQLADQLVGMGLQSAYGITGSGPSWRFISEIESRGVRYYPVSHEAAGAIMAGVTAHLTGHPSASISIKGPGLANMLPGVVHNAFEGYPAVSISEAYGPSAPSFRKHKRLDHRGLISSTSKAVATLSDLDGGIRGLWDLARAEVPGPVHIELCEGGISPGIVFEPPVETAATAADRARVLKLLRDSSRPAVIVGSLVWRRSWRGRLERLTVPVLTTVAAKGAVDERLAHSAGVFTGAGRRLAPETSIFAEADLVVGLGLRNTEILAADALGPPTLLVDEVGGDLGEGFGADIRVTDAGEAFIEEVLDLLADRSWGQGKIAELLATLAGNVGAGEWLPAACFDVLNRLELDHRLVLDTGSFCTIGEHVWEARPLRPFLGSSISRYMGTAIPSAIGAAIAQREIPVVCVCGDGGMRMYPAEIALAVAEGLPISFVLMADGLFGSILCSAKDGSESRRAVTIQGPSWWEAIRGMGCPACSVHSTEEFESVIRSWNGRGTIFVEATFEPEQYGAMTADLR